MQKFLIYTGLIALAVVLILVIGLVAAWPVMWIVNYLFAPSALLAVFGTPTLGYWKAYWLFFFFGLAFKSSSSSSS